MTGGSGNDERACAELGRTLDLMKLLGHRYKICPVGKTAVSLAGVLIDESPILFFDEPLANLDPKSGQDIDLIDQIHEEQGRPLLLSNTV